MRRRFASFFYSPFPRTIVIWGMLWIVILYAIPLLPVNGAPIVPQDATDYPPIEVTSGESGYPEPATQTPEAGLASPTAEGGGQPTPDGGVTMPATLTSTGGPNQFLTENAEMGDSVNTKTTQQDLPLTRTLTPSLTAVQTRTSTAHPTQQAAPPASSTPSSLIWVLAGVLLPFVLLAFGFLGVGISRSGKAS